MADITITQGTVSHALSATTPNDPTAEVQMQHWNSGHAASIVLAAAVASALFSNANGISFGLSESAITGSHNALTAQSVQTQPAGNIAGAGFTSTTTAGVEVKATHNSVGLSMAVPAYLTTQSVQTQASGDIARSGATTGTTAGVDVKATLNSGGLSLAVPAYITTAALSNHSHGNPTLALTNLSGTTASNSAGLTLSLSAAAPGGGAADGFNRIAAGTQTADTLATVLFENSNGITFGMSGSTRITASYTQSTHDHPYRNSTDAVGLNTALTGNGVAWTVNSSGISLNVPAFLTTAAQSNHSHGNPTLALTNLSGTTASNSNGLTLSLSAAAVGGPGGGATDIMWWPFNQAQNVTGQAGQGSFAICPADRFNDVNFDRVMFPLVYSNATNSTGSVTISMWMGIYTKNASTLSLLHSMSTTQGFTHSGTVRNSLMSGIRLLSMPWTTTVTGGQYWVGIGSRTTTGGGNATVNQLLVSQFTNATQGAFSGILGAASATSVQWPLGLGHYSATTSAIPASIAFSQIVGTGTLNARPPSWFAPNGTV